MNRPADNSRKASDPWAISRWQLRRCRSTICFAGCIAGMFLAAACPAQQPENGAQPAPAANNIRYWNTSWSFDSIDAGQLNRRLRAIGIDTGLQLDGTVTVRFEVGIPLNALRNGRAYRFQGRITSDRFRVEGVELLEFVSTVRYDDGVLSLPELRTQTASGGSISGQSTLQLIPRGQLRADVSVESLRLSPIIDLVEGVGSGVGSAEASAGDSGFPLEAGELTGQVKFRAPLENLRDPASWSLQSEFRASEMLVRGLPPLNLTAEQLTIQNSLLALRNLVASSPTEAELSLRGSVQLELAGDRRFAFDGVANDLPLERLLDLAQSDPDVDGGSPTSFIEPLVAGKVDLQAAGDGTLSEGQWRLRGSVASPSLVLAGLDLGLVEHDFRFSQNRLVLEPREAIEGQVDRGAEVEPAPDALAATNPEQRVLGRVELELQQTEETLGINVVQGEIFEGSISGEARVARDQGVHRFDFQFDNLRPRFVRTEQHGSIAATLSGSVDWQVPAEQISRPAAHRGTANVQLRNLSLDDEIVGDLNVTASAQDGDLDLNAEGELFGGTVAVETISSFDVDDTWNAWLDRVRATRVELSGVRLESFLPVALDSPLRVRGLLSANLNLDAPRQEEARSGENGFARWRGRGTVQLVQLYSDGKLVSREMRGRIAIQNNVLIVQQLSGYYAGGSVYVTGRVPLNRRSPRTGLPYADLSVALQRVDLSRGLLPLGDAIAENAQGIVSGQLSVRGGDGWRARGRLQSERLRVTAITFGRAHSSLEADLAADLSRWSVRFTDVSARVGSGRFNGKATLRSPPGRSVGFDLDSQWRADRVDFVRFVSELGAQSSIARGQMTGRISLKGRAIRSPSDLEGSFAMRLGETRGAAVPGLTLAQQFLGPLSIATTQFESGEASGIIGRGALNIQEFWLSGDQARVHANGRIWLSNGRLDMEALIATGDFRNASESVVALAQQYALESLIPLSAVREIARLASNRTLVVAVSGTVSDPRLRLLPLETLQQEAARFLMQEICRIAIVSAVGSSIYGND